MAKVSFTVSCIASYHSELDIPNEIKDNEDEVLSYIHEHLDECGIEELTWLSDLKAEDAVTKDDIKRIS